MSAEFSNRYTSAGAPPNLTSINSRVRNLANDAETDEGRVRHSVAIAVICDFMEDITLSDHDERLLLKGGTAMRLRFGLEKARFSKDLDAMLRGEVVPFLERLRERGRDPYCGWTFEVTKEQAIEVPGMVAKPRRADVKLAYQGKPYSTVRLELAPEEGTAAEEHDVAASDELEALGFRTGAKARHLLAVRYQVAQKMHACTTPRHDGKPNDRAHDLIDLALLEELTRTALARTRQACIEIFGLRATQWPPTVLPEHGWEAQYAKQVLGLEGSVPPNLTEAVVAIQRLVDDIDAAGPSTADPTRT